MLAHGTVVFEDDSVTIVDDSNEEKLLPLDLEKAALIRAEVIGKLKKGKEPTIAGPSDFYKTEFTSEYSGLVTIGDIARKTMKFG